MEKTAEILARNIKYFRKLKFLTQEQLASKAGISLRSLQSAETGERSPRADTLSSIAGALGVSQKDLYEDRLTNLDDRIENTTKRLEQAVKLANIMMGDARTSLIMNLGIDLSNPSDMEFLDGIENKLEKLKNIPVEVLLLLMEQDSTYFESLLRSLQVLESKKSKIKVKASI